MKCKNKCFELSSKKIEESNKNLHEVKFPHVLVITDTGFEKKYSIPIRYKKLKRNGKLSEKEFEIMLPMTYCPICGEKLETGE